MGKRYKRLWKEAAKTALETYKNVADYTDEGKASLSAIIAQAKTGIDACTSFTEFSKAFADARAAMDGVETKLDIAKAAVLEELLAYLDTIDLEEYDTDGKTEILTYFFEAEETLEKATAESEFANLVAETTAKVEGVAKMEKQQPVVDGCGSVAGLTAGVTLAATAAAVALRKKKED